MEEPKDKITLLTTIIKEIDREHLKWYPLSHLGSKSDKAPCYCEERKILLQEIINDIKNIII
jgi:hypothetical protein